MAFNDAPEPGIRSHKARKHGAGLTQSISDSAGRIEMKEKYGSSKRAFRRILSARTMALVSSLLVSLGVSGCDGLLEVTLPGNLEEKDLNNPALAATLVLGAQSDFDCGMSAWIRSSNLWAGELFSASTSLAYGATEARRSVVDQYGPGECDSGSSPNIPGLWLPFQISRVQAESAIERINSFPEGSVPNKNFLIARANAYAGYSYQHLGEGFCELYFDRGPRVTREETFRLAEARFTEALRFASQVTSGPDVGSARSIANLARVGRARSRLHLGNGAGVLEDAGAVERGFLWTTDHSGTTNRRRNNLFQDNHVNRSLSAQAKDFRLTVGGVPDPRVELVFRPGAGSAGRTDLYLIQKYRTASAPIPVASWREAQLMIAEVSGGQTAVGIINALRTTHGLPQFASQDPAEIRKVLIEERRRELYLEGKQLGDMLRLKLPFPTGLTPGGESIDESTPTCLPTMAAERLGNPNARQ
jgi:hypothetical protein